MSKSLRDLIPSVSKVTRALGVSDTAVYTWIKNNAIPPKRAIHLADALDVPVQEVLPFIAKVSVRTHIVQKPKSALPVLIEAAHRRITIEEAAKRTGLPEKSVSVTIGRWGVEGLERLHRVLEALYAEEIDLAEAAKQLGVEKHAVHQLRTRYGYKSAQKKPSPKAPPKPRPYKENTAACRAKAIDVIAGRVTAIKGAKDAGLSLRSLHRHIVPMLAPRSQKEIALWSSSFRQALAWEIAKNQRKHVEKWRESCENLGISLRKRMYKPKKVENLREATTKHLIMAILGGDKTLEEVAVTRRADPRVLESLFNSDLRPLGTSWSEVCSLSVHHQFVVAEVMAAILKRGMETNAHHLNRKEN